jgi:hypothetical protein
MIFDIFKREEIAISAIFQKRAFVWQEIGLINYPRSLETSNA